MSEYVNQEIAESFSDGLLLGKTEPTRETKYSWWEVYLKNREVVACVVDEFNGISCGEKIQRDEIGSYVDDAEEALKHYDHKLSEVL